MKIAVVAHIRHAISQPYKGGMESHCHMLCDGLRRRGHDVTLFAAGGSSDDCLVPICDAPYEQVLPWNVYRGSSRLADYQRDAFEQVLLNVGAGGFDVVHNNSLFPELMDWFAAAGVPCVTSQHVPPFEAMVQAVIRSTRKSGNVVTCTSADQQRIWDERGFEDTRVVPNGVDTSKWQPAREVADFFTWVGRIVPNKGLAEAVAAARMAGISMRIFGPIEDVPYFVDRVEPLLGQGVEYHGHQTFEQLRDQLCRAAAAVVTPMWDEPFGLVAAEALSCGVPVVGFDRGALREVVGDCGVLVEAGDVAALSEGMARVGEIDRELCRQRAVTQLSIEAMIDGYEQCYEAAVAGARISSLARLCWSSRAPRTTALLA